MALLVHHPIQFIFIPVLKRRKTPQKSTHTTNQKAPPPPPQKKLLKKKTIQEGADIILSAKYKYPNFPFSSSSKIKSTWVVGLYPQVELQS